MDIAAGIITIIQTAWTLASKIKGRVNSIRQQDLIARNLADKVELLTTILGTIHDQASSVYGQDDSRCYTLREQVLRQALQKVVGRCKSDLQSFEIKTKKLVNNANWASVAWKQQILGPTIASIETSISEHQDHLQMLVLLLQSVQMPTRAQLCQIQDIQRQMHILLQTLTNTSTNDIPPSVAAGDDVADADSLYLCATTTLIGKAEIADGQDNGTSNTNETLDLDEELESRHGLESNTNGTSLLDAINRGDNEDFESLLHDDSTSLKVMDSKGRTPLLLAADQDRVEMVKTLLSTVAGADHNATAASSSSTENYTNAATEAKSTDHREVDFNAVDSLGRSALHYCAEFDKCDEARFIIGQGANVNALDRSNHPPAYYAIQNGKLGAVKLLLEEGATMQFDRPTEINDDITKLLQTASANGNTATVPTNSF
ncbi:MAG: hypothetical protein Q9213_000316 [Squamulea squamosa]